MAEHFAQDHRRPADTGGQRDSVAPSHGDLPGRLNRRPAVLAQARLAEALTRRKQVATSPAAPPRSASPKPALQAKGQPLTGGHDPPAAETPLTKPSAAVAARAAVGEEPWWRLRVDCRLHKEAHSLYFLGTPENPALVINPGPTFLTTYLAGFPTATPAQQTEKGELEKLAKAVRDAAATNNPLNVYSALTQLGHRLGTVGAAVPGHGRPPSNIRFEAKTDQYGNDYGIKTTAHLLSVHQGNSPGGSPPVEKSTWATVSNRHPSFVRGHLLNKHLHGPGTGNNLTPLTDTVNRQMSKHVEEPLKTEILDKNNVYFYEIEPTYGVHAAKDGYSDDDLKYIPTRITMTYYPLTLDAGKDGKDAADWKRAGAPATVVPIDQALPVTADEAKRGNLHKHDVLRDALAAAAAGTLVEPGKKASKIKKQSYALAKGGQKTVDALFAAATASAAAAALPPEVEQEIVAAEETLAHDYEHLAGEKLSADDVASFRAEAMENAEQTYFDGCTGAGFDGTPWLSQLRARLRRVRP